MAYNKQSITAGTSTNLVVSPNPLTGVGTIDLNTTSITNHGILIGGGSGAALKATAALTDGQLLIGKSGFDPVVATLTAGSGVMIDSTTIPGAITISAPQVGTVTSVSSANADIGVATGTTTPVLTLNPALTFITSITALALSDLTLAAATPANNVVISNTLKTNAGQIAKRILVDSLTTVSYTALATDYIIGVNTTTAAVTVILPASISVGTAQTYVIKDENGQAATKNILITPNGTNTIDGITGAGAFTINNAYESITLYNNGNGNWSVM